MSARDLSRRVGRLETCGGADGPGEPSLAHLTDDELRARIEALTARAAAEPPDADLDAEIERLRTV